MKTLRVRLTLWFTLGFLAVTATFMWLTYRHLDLELRRQTFEREFDVRPDWILRGSFTEAEVREIMSQLIVASLIYSLPLVLVTLLLGYFIARKSLRPISHLNEQLQIVGPRTLHRRVELREDDEQFRDLLQHLNDMLARLERSFAEMSEYAAKVTHELRTPLTILRLKVEQSNGRIDPSLAEELEGELHHLSHVVDQSLLIAKADQGKVKWESRRVDLAEMVTDLVNDFRLLADDEGRDFAYQPPRSCVAWTDPDFCRQIIHALLSNALTHGVGDIRIRLLARGSRARFTILNPVRHAPKPQGQALGLGLRVVAALLSRQPEVRFRRHQGRSLHAASLTFPLDTRSVGVTPRMQHAKTPSGVGS